tara:strand:- start:1170 stop:1415 length:246 start_codon:yes stop_codon:yes gene_type:complete
MSEAIKPLDCGDDNEEIKELIKQRMDLGKQRYGHGVKVDDDTTQYGTDKDAWELMALEEILDGMIYSAAAIIRLRRKRQVN